MTKRNRRQRRAARRQATAEKAAPPAVEPPSPEPEVQPEADDAVSPDGLDAMIDSIQPDEVLVLLSCGDDTHMEVFPGRSIVGAAEEAAVRHVDGLGAFPAYEISAECYTDFGHFGPFPIELELTANATRIRGDADE
ncbi:MAG: hypothetical protein AAFV88_11585 [Planctomycetota bacterium]